MRRSGGDCRAGLAEHWISRQRGEPSSTGGQAVTPHPGHTTDRRHSTRLGGRLGMRLQRSPLAPSHIARHAPAWGSRAFVSHPLSTILVERRARRLGYERKHGGWDFPTC